LAHYWSKLFFLPWMIDYPLGISPTIIFFIKSNILGFITVFFLSSEYHLNLETSP
jgi:hypothetical protein